MGSGGITYLPLVSGILQSVAQSHPILSKKYKFMPFIFSVDNPSKILNQYKTPPNIAAFSISMWNEYLSLHVASEIKKRYPNCLIIFGGAQCPHNPTEYFEKYKFIDVAVRAEGEIAFNEILLRYLETNHDFSEIANVAFRNLSDGQCIINSNNIVLNKNLDLYPSPYLSGVYEYLYSDKEHDYQVIIETNRGCPFLCTFCYWGRGGYTRKFRFHSLDRIREELEWVGKHKVSYIFNADSNFGMHKRDMKIAEMLAETKARYGYPEKFRTCWGKNTDERIFSVASFLHSKGLDKGMTLGRQSNSVQVLDNIKRKNIKLETFTNLQRKFNEQNVPIYAELILGLPGETLDSWVDGIEQTLQAGINNQLFVYEAEVLPNTELSEKTYQKKFSIKTQIIKLTEIHCDPRAENWIQEYQEIIIQSSTFTVNDWRKMLVISSMTMLLHSMKLGFYLLGYLHKYHKINYTDLIVFVVEKGSSDKYGIITEEVNQFFSYADNLLNGEGRGQLLPRFGNIFWYIEEASFLRIAERLDEFYIQLEIIVAELLHNREISFDKQYLSEVFKYQKAKIPTIDGASKIECSFQLNIGDFFENMFKKKQVKLKKTQQTLVFSQPNYFGDKKKFANTIVLKGRKSGNICRAIG